MRPVRPEPEELPKIKRAMRAARFMRWGSQSVVLLVLCVAIYVGGTSEWYFGVALFVAICAPFLILGFLAARCPHCGQVWWADGARWMRDGQYETADETETMVCRRCRLDIGLGLRE